jgi:hypothetical protein
MNLTSRALARDRIAARIAADGCSPAVAAEQASRWGTSSSFAAGVPYAKSNISSKSMITSGKKAWLIVPPVKGNSSCEVPSD